MLTGATLEFWIDDFEDLYIKSKFNDNYILTINKDNFSRFFGVLDFDSTVLNGEDGIEVYSTNDGSDYSKEDAYLKATKLEFRGQISSTTTITGLETLVYSGVRYVDTLGDYVACGGFCFAYKQNFDDRINSQLGKFSDTSLVNQYRAYEHYANGTIVTSYDSFSGVTYDFTLNVYSIFDGADFIYTDVFLSQFFDVAEMYYFLRAYVSTTISGSGEKQLNLKEIQITANQTYFADSIISSFKAYRDGELTGLSDPFMDMKPVEDNKIIKINKYRIVGKVIDLSDSSYARALAGGENIFIGDDFRDLGTSNLPAFLNLESFSMYCRFKSKANSGDRYIGGTLSWLGSGFAYEGIGFFLRNNLIGIVIGATTGPPLTFMSTIEVLENDWGMLFLTYDTGTGNLRIKVNESEIESLNLSSISVNIGAKQAFSVGLPFVDVASSWASNYGLIEVQTFGFENRLLSDSDMLSYWEKIINYDAGLNNPSFETQGDWTGNAESWSTESVVEKWEVFPFWVGNGFEDDQYQGFESFEKWAIIVSFDDIETETFIFGIEKLRETFELWDDWEYTSVDDILDPNKETFVFAPDIVRENFCYGWEFAHLFVYSNAYNLLYIDFTYGTVSIFEGINDEIKFVITDDTSEKTITPYSFIITEGSYAIAELAAYIKSRISFHTFSVNVVAIGNRLQITFASDPIKYLIFLQSSFFDTALSYYSNNIKYGDMGKVWTNNITTIDQAEIFAYFSAGAPIARESFSGVDGWYYRTGISDYGDILQSFDDIAPAYKVVFVFVDPAVVTDVRENFNNSDSNWGTTIIIDI